MLHTFRPSLNLRNRGSLISRAELVPRNKLHTPSPFIKLHNPLETQSSTRPLTYTSFKMSSKEFSNTSTGGKSADPYKAKNLDEPNIKEKVTDLITFIESSKFGMMTTRQDSTGLLVSRCMALAAKVRTFSFYHR